MPWTIALSDRPGPLLKLRSKILAFLLVVPFQVVWIGAFCQDARFHVFKGEDVVGNILVSRTAIGDRTSYSMTSHSEFDLFWRQVITSRSCTEYGGGSLSACHTSVAVNGTMRDSSSLAKFHDGMACFVHPDRRFKHSGTVDWTTARMYFEEPVGSSHIFVESVLQLCPLQRTGPGTYRLTLAKGKVNHYTYRNGVLQEILVERTFFDLVFRRA